MTKCRKVANPIFSRPLTHAEDMFNRTGKALTPTLTGRPILCHKCGLGGGTLIKVDDYYQHQNTVLCRILHGR